VHPYYNKRRGNDSLGIGRFVLLNKLWPSLQLILVVVFSLLKDFSDLFYPMTYPRPNYST
jgi:hypothetical protein